MWATGEQLRNSPDAAQAAQLARSGALNVDGLQGNGTWRIRRNDEPPSMSYFIDYDDDFRDQAARGHLGDIAIARPCTATQHTGGDLPPQRPAVEPPPGTPPGGTPPANHPPTNPPGSACPPGQVRRAGGDSCGSCSRPNVQIGGKCCAPGDLAAGGACSNSSCSTGQTAIGPSNFCCSSGQVYTNAAGAQACCAGALVNGQCPSPTQPGCTPGSTNPQCCPTGYVSTGNSCCLASQINSAGVCCPAGQAPSGPNKNQCAVLVKIPRGPQCCAAGLIPAGGGECCAAANVTTTGICCSGPVDPKNRTNCPAQIQIIPKCAAGYSRMPDGSCCNDRYVGDNGKSCNAGPAPPKPRAPLIPPVPRGCPSGMTRDSDGDCVRQRSSRCAPSDIRLDDGTCAPSAPAPGPPRFGPGGFGPPYGPPRYFGGPGRFGPGRFGPGRFGPGRFGPGGFGPGRFR